MKLTRRARRRAVWSGLVAVVLAAVVVGYTLTRSSNPAAASAATAKVGRGAVTVEVSASGAVASVQTRGLSFATSGTVTELNVRAGDMVVKNQVLARIDESDAQDALESALERLADADEALDDAITTANLPACPTTTAPNSPPSPSAGTGSAQPAGTGSAQPAGTGSAQPAGTGSTGGSGSGSAATPTCTQAGRTSTSDALLSAQQRYNEAELAVVRARTQLAGTVIRAPIVGRVLSVGGQVGGAVSPGGTGFIVLGDVASLSVQAQFSEADVSRLAVGQVASITLPDRDEPVPGTVSQIDPAGTVANRLVRYGVVIAFDAVPADLLLGQSATVLVTTASVANVLYVSSAAISGVADGAGAVTVRTPAGDVVRRVRVGLRGDQFTEVTEGLAEGDEVVLPASG